MQEKTLFISSFHPLISRNLLQTEALELLAGEPGLRIVVLCPKRKEEYFRAILEEVNKGKGRPEGVQVLGIDDKPLSRKEQIWKEIGNALLRTSTIRGNRKERYSRDRNVFGYAVFLFIQHVLARLPIFSRIYQSLSPKCFDSSAYKKVFKEMSEREKGRTFAVFSSDIFHDEDVRLLAGARRAGIRTIGMVRSWDNCTNKGILPVIPDALIVHNEIISGELEEFHGAGVREISIVGIPQFDYYKGYKPEDPGAFFSVTGFEKGRKIITFAPTGKKFVDDDAELLQAVVDAVADGTIQGKPQVLVRFPPGDAMDLDRVRMNPDVKIFVDRPGVAFDEARLKDREMSKGDMARLADTLYSTDVLISVGSTLCIDIAAFDKPIVMPAIAIPGIRGDRSMRKMYKKFHYAYLLRTEGCAYPQTMEEYINEINDALHHPEKRREGRKRLIMEQAGDIDGLSCSRLAHAIKKNII